MNIQKPDIEKDPLKHLTKGVAMKMVRVMMLTAAVMACGAWVSFAGTSQKPADSTKTAVCDTTKCKLHGSHADAMKNCPLHKGMKCTMADSAECKRMHGKADSTEHHSEKPGK
jgi:hypothetical protein